MASQLELSVIVLSFQRPRQLQLCLTSLAAQQGVDGRFEVIIADDGSTDETAAVVSQFAARSDFSVRFLTHDHRGIHRAYCRNKAISAASAPYLLFIEDDCILPPRHLAQHLAARTSGVVRAGNCVRFSEAVSQQIDANSVRTGQFVQLADRKMVRAAKRNRRNTAFHALLRRRDRPKVVGCDFAAWRDDLIRVNGFDQRFPRNNDEVVELSSRLRAVGVRISCVLGYTQGYRVWSPPRPAAPAPIVLAGMVMGQRSLVLPRCLEGIECRAFADLTVRVIAEPYEAGIVRQIMRSFRGQAAEPDIEVLLYPTAGRFTAPGARRIVVIQNSEPLPLSLRWSAHEVIDLNGPRRGAAVTSVLQRLLGIDARQAMAA